MWLHIQTVNPIWHFDATGSIVVDILGEKKPLLYSIVCHDSETNSIIPVFEFVTTCHSEDNLAKFLSILRRKFRREIPSVKYYSIAPIVVMDFSWASINATLDAFNMCNIDQYIRWCFDMLFKNGSIENAINVLIYICSTHMLKLTVDKVKKIQCVDQKKDLKGINKKRQKFAKKN